MGIADKLQTTPRTQTGLPCSVSVLLSKLNDEDREALEGILKNTSSGSISSRQIYEIITAEGHEVAFTAVANHRRKACRCFSNKDSARAASGQKA